jgi:hypothetical protein
MQLDAKIEIRTDEGSNPITDNRWKKLSAEK